MTGPSIPPLDIPALLKQHGLRPSKGLGQNFLRDDQVLQKIVAAADLSPADDVLEIGPGLGSLTRYLALSSRSVTAVELDPGLFPALESVLALYDNVHLVQGDILELEPAALGLHPGYIVVANIPYYITSALVRHLLESEPRPRRLVLTLQREVAERICSGPGEMSLLALGVQVYGEPRIVAQVPAEAFYPAPKVDSAVLRVETHAEPAVPSPQLDTFFALCRAGFSQKRKKLRNSLAAGLRIAPEAAGQLLVAAGIDPDRRAETLSLEEWGELTRRYRR